MLRIAVCDDCGEDTLYNRDMIVSDLLGRGLNDFVIDCFTEPEKLLDCNTVYSLIFLDIEMNGHNGIETAMKIREKGITTPFVYVTNYRDFAFLAYSVFPLSLVTKPLLAETVKSVMDEFLRRDGLIMSKAIEVKTAGGLVMLLPSDIIYFNCVARKDVIAVTGSASITLTERFDDIYEKVADYNFFRCRRDIIVNMLHVKAYLPGNKVLMSNNMTLSVSHRKSTEFCLALSKTAIAEFNGR